MPREDLAGFLGKKSYEISYALLRIASAVRSLPLAQALEKASVNIISFDSSGSYSDVAGCLEEAEKLLRLGSDSNMINPKNADAVIHEMNGIKSYLSEVGSSDILPDLNIPSIFSRQKPANQAKRNPAIERQANPANRQSAELQSNPADVSGSETVVDEGISFAELPDNDENKQNNSEMRQSAILGIIRQSSSCRMKDILDTLPDVSERTIRYDLQDLVERGLVERMGSGGPGTYYRPRLAA